jgi:hypothetical protein
MIKKLFIIALICALVGGVIAIYLLNKPHKKVENADAVKITAVDLCKSFTDDKNKAAVSYLNKAIEVTGEVADVILNQDGGTMVILKTNDPILAVQCTMREKGIKLEKGSSVTIKGFYSDFSDITGVLLTDCIIE